MEKLDSHAGRHWCCTQTTAITVGSHRGSFLKDCHLERNEAAALWLSVPCCRRVVVSDAYTLSRWRTRSFLFPSLSSGRPISRHHSGFPIRARCCLLMGSEASRTAIPAATGTSWFSFFFSAFYSSFYFLPYVLLFIFSLFFASPISPYICILVYKIIP